jgi:hypothetical protein
MSESGIESPVMVTMSPVSSPTQPQTSTTNQLMLVLPDLEEIASSQNAKSPSPPPAPVPVPASAAENITIELQQVKEPETQTTPQIQPQPQPPKTENQVEAEPEKESESKKKLIEEKVVVVVKDFKYCYEEFEKQIKSQNLVISMDTIMRMLRIAMVIVEQTNESGKNKKDFVVRMIAKIVSDCADSSTMSSEMKVEILNMLYSPLFDDTIKLVVDASKGTLDLNKVQEVASQVAVGCFSRCLAFMSKKK